MVCGCGEQSGEHDGAKYTKNFRRFHAAPPLARHPFFPYLEPMTDSRTQNRRLVRETVMQALYAHEIAKDSPEHVMNTVLQELKEVGTDYDFACSLFLKTVTHQSAVDALIKTRAEHWEFYRIALLDKILLRMAVCELLHFPDIPPKVSINEAIEIAKDFSTDGSSTFINGVLDAILIDLKKNGSLAKSGRGLVESSKPKPKHAAR